MSKLNLEFVRSSPWSSHPEDATHLSFDEDADESMRPVATDLPNSFLVPANITDSLSGVPAAHHSHADPSLQFKHGTTTLGFVFQGGVLICVDSRASMGSYIGSGTVKKVIEITPYLLGTMAGGAADCSFWERNLARECHLHELKEGKRITVAAASKVLGNMVYSYKGMGLSMGTMVAGWDLGKGPALYYIDSDGTRLKGDRFCVGSGSTFAYGVLDNGYRFDMTDEEAIRLGRRSIWHATHRDAYSGGYINCYVIREKGWTRYNTFDMNELYYDYYKPQRDIENQGRQLTDEEKKRFTDPIEPWKQRYGQN